MHCRFCVDWFQPGSTIIADWDNKIHNDIVTKLSILRCNVDFPPDSPLPKNICSKCYKALTFIYNFVIKVNNSQSKLYDIVYSKDYNGEKEIKCEYENKETMTDAFEVSDDFDSTEYFDVEIEGIKYESNSDETKCFDISSDFPAESSSAENETWSNYTWTCCHCELNFSCMAELISHSRTTHDTCYAYRCIDCSKTQTCFKNFIKHVKSHRKYLSKYCPYCDQHMDKDHTSIHTTDHAVCTKCGEICENDTALKLHQNLDSNSLKCKVCLKVYKSPYHLRRHEETVHDRNRTRKYTCHKCGKMYFNQFTLESHILIHDKKHTCKICTKTFVSMAKLRRHVDVHTGRKSFACEKCGRTFRLKEQLKSHMIIHTEEMPHKCEVCGKAFRFKQTLANHSRLHTGVKPYSCNICGMTFANWSNYNKHMVRKHKSDTAKKKITPMGVFSVNPETGKVVKPVSTDEIEEWRTKIMVPSRKTK